MFPLDLVVLMFLTCVGCVLLFAIADEGRLP